MAVPASIRRPCGRRRALTLIELLIALSITTVTCAILAILIKATADGTNSQNDGRRSLVRLQSLKATLQDEFTNTKAILATGSNYVVYWIGDQAGAVTPANGAVNFSELRLLEIDASNNLNVYYCQWPAGTTSATILANDTLYAASTDFYATAEALKGTTYFTSKTLMSGATTLSASLDSATATNATYIHLRVDANDGLVTRQLVLGVDLTNPAPPW